MFVKIQPTSVCCDNLMNFENEARLYRNLVVFVFSVSSRASFATLFYLFSLIKKRKKQP